jgi:hypothetical protein
MIAHGFSRGKKGEPHQALEGRYKHLCPVPVPNESRIPRVSPHLYPHQPSRF